MVVVKIRCLLCLCRIDEPGLKAYLHSLEDLFTIRSAIKGTASGNFKEMR